MKKFLSLLMTIIILFSLTPALSADAATIKISKEKATMEVDSTLKLKVIGASGKVTWKTDEKAVATVTSTGTITAKEEGNAIITATVGDTEYTCAVTVVNSNKTSAAEKIYSLGDTWTVDGFWAFTFNSATSTDKRNQYSDKTPNQVVVLDYIFENLGFQSNIIDFYTSSDHMKVLDEKGEAASTYPGNLIIYPIETPSDKKYSGAQEVFGLNNESSIITVYVEIYDNNKEKHNATFKLKVD